MQAARFGRDSMDFGDMRGGGRFGGRRRMFDGNELRLVLLKLIADEPRHGYDLIRAIEERTGGVYAPSPGVVYPTLTLLSDMGLIAEQATEQPRKLFAVTEDGTRHLEEHADEVVAVLARLDALRDQQDRGGAMPLRRAMMNLWTVVGNRMRERVDREKVNEAVRLIDEVARKIEQL
ncbi:PadR family transcriptional regulator [Mangrovibrevibacter kandeliae]|uniref:PadR family transcriptional regulator n=1 Tax=Mangrovibrevibacter kandeliae TaxID=2968473 RepID=UPI0021184D45|nr:MULTISPECIES: PadR family transcriptional regulator [unclassified Aurantimonas]MCQ8780833.1 PadR family transcriptional regulator [Aurantimonas sp. CSK15Z-1]MCW4113613.1 PadR family transcriptional regulator [Aurantimonas sp. MSK8Z-1]